MRRRGTACCALLLTHIMNETELLFTEILSCNRSQLYLERKRKLSLEDSARIAGALRRRISGEPIQYILGKTEFMGLEFKVSPAVLIPRPDTEELVETVLRYGRNRDTRAQEHKSTRVEEHNGQESLEVLEIGTGSGCIAVSLAKFLPQVKICAVDISRAALEIAKQNAQLNGTLNRINFLNCDLFPPLEQYGIKYDIIISNPPYIKTKIIQTLEVEVQREPREALDGGEDGQDFYRRIIRESSAYLKRSGLLILEIGFGQKEELEKIFSAEKIFEVKEVIKDYNGIHRVVVAQMVIEL